MNFRVNVNGIDIDAVYSERNIDEIFLPLLRKLTDLQNKLNRRVVVFLAAPPGVGKTTLSLFLEYLSNKEKGITPIQAVGMDGFHHYQNYLLSHEAEVDGKLVKMVEIKGNPITFNLDHLKEKLDELKFNRDVKWPTYNRLEHNPTENSVTINHDIIVIEGNYLLLNFDGWNDLKKYADYTIFISSEEETVRERLINRKIASGTSKDEAIRFVDFSDMRNFRFCLENSNEANLELFVNSIGEYIIKY